MQRAYSNKVRTFVSKDPSTLQSKIYKPVTPSSLCEGETRSKRVQLSEKLRSQYEVSDVIKVYTHIIFLGYEDIEVIHLPIKYITMPGL